MAKWYEIVKDKKYIDDFMYYVRGLHDCRVVNVNCSYEKQFTDIFIQYDSEKEGIVLRFLGVKRVHLNVTDDFPAYWLYDTDILISDDNTLIWFDDGECGDEFDELKDYMTWAEADKILFAFTDGKGNIQDIPEDRIDALFERWNDMVHEDDERTVKTFKWVEYTKRMF